MQSEQEHIYLDTLNTSTKLLIVYNPNNYFFFGKVEGLTKETHTNTIKADILTRLVIPSVRSWISIYQAQIKLI